MERLGLWGLRATIAVAGALSAGAAMPAASAQSAADSVRRIERVPAGIEWRESPNGIASARLEGDASVEGSHYTLLLRLRDGAWIPPHWHLHDKRILVLSGTLLMGWGREIDSAAATVIGPGGFVLVPGGARHYEGGRGETTIALYGVGPLTTTFVR